MRNSLILLTTLLLLAGCSTPFTKPVVNVYYIQEQNSTTQPKIDVHGDRISISTIEKKPDPTPPKAKIKLYFVYESVCPDCTQLQKTMRRDDISTLLDTYFEVERVHIDHRERLPKAWMRPFRAPTIYFLDPQYKELIPSIHGMRAQRFKEKLQEVIETFKEQQKH